MEKKLCCLINPVWKCDWCTSSGCTPCVDLQCVIDELCPGRTASAYKWHVWDYVNKEA